MSHRPGSKTSTTLPWEKWCGQRRGLLLPLPSTPGRGRATYARAPVPLQVQYVRDGLKVGARLYPFPRPTCVQHGHLPAPWRHACAPHARCALRRGAKCDLRPCLNDSTVGAGWRAAANRKSTPGTQDDQIASHRIASHLGAWLVRMACACTAATYCSWCTSAPARSRVRTVTPTPRPCWTCSHAGAGPGPRKSRLETELSRCLCHLGLPQERANILLAGATGVWRERNN